MIIAIASSENNLNSGIDPLFGRCNWYCLYDTQYRKSEFIENPVKNNLEKAGCDAAELLLQYHIEMAIAGRFGSKVVSLFRGKNIQMVIPETQQSVNEIIKLVNNII